MHKISSEAAGIEKHTRLAALFKNQFSKILGHAI